MIVNVLSDLGVVFKDDGLAVVHKVLKKGESIPSHNHEDNEIFFIAVKGKLETLFDEDESHIAEAGSILHFDGKHHISAVALEDSEIFVFLKKKK